jgi:hypothetical protein
MGLIARQVSKTYKTFFYEKTLRAASCLYPANNNHLCRLVHFL